jgi:hypothetical protein
MWDEFKLWLNKRFTLHHLVLWDGMCRNLSFGLATKAKGVARVRA